MMPLRSALIAVSLGGSTLSARAAGDRDDLDRLAAEVKASRVAAISSVVDQLEKAATTPRTAQEFFLDSVKKFDFKHDLDEGPKFEQWKTAFLAQWHGHDLGIVLQMQLHHQALVLRTVAAEDRAALVPAWAAFAESVVKNAHEAAFGISFLAQPVNQSVFDKALKLRQLAGGNAFGVSAIDIGGIYDAFIHPHVAQKERAGAWERRIELQKQFAEATMLPSEREDFVNFEIPRLRWREFVDIHIHDGRPDAAAVADGTRFVRQNKLHPDAAAWAALLRQVRDASEARSR
jgi:hypothetical protein